MAAYTLVEILPSINSTLSIDYLTRDVGNIDNINITNEEFAYEDNENQPELEENLNINHENEQEQDQDLELQLHVQPQQNLPEENEDPIVQQQETVMAPTNNALQYAQTQLVIASIFTHHDVQLQYRNHDPK